MNNKPAKEPTPTQLLTLFQSTFRNIGLYTSIGLAILVGSRYYRNQKKFSFNHLFLLLLSLMFILYAIFVNYFMVTDFNKFIETNTNDVSHISKWINLSYTILFFNITFAIYIIFVMASFR